MARPRSNGRLWLVLIPVLWSMLAAPVAGPAVPAAAAPPSGFREYIVFGGLINPTAVEFSADGRVFVAEKRGVIKVFSNVDDRTPTVFADLRTQVYNYWDHGLLGMRLHPDFPENPSVYVLYSRDALPGGSAPHWGTAGQDVDACPTPPGPTADGCVSTGRLSVLTAAGNTSTGTERVLITDWCQQSQTHSIGSLDFGADGALYVSAGDGAKSSGTDYGQYGYPKVNPCGDPPGGVGGVMTPPSAQGGALRSQAVRGSANPINLDGAVLRLDPDTGAAMPGNPLGASADANKRRIVAYGLRNPFRMTVKPGTNELWLGDVGMSTWEEINRVANPVAGVTNFGWPCYEGAPRHPGYDAANLTLCESLYSAGTAIAPVVAYRHDQAAFATDTCKFSAGSSASGLAFYPGGNYPDSYDNVLFTADYSRDCIWVMRADQQGNPDPAQRSTFAAGAANPVELQIGPDGDLWYVDLEGTIRRIGYSDGNQPPLAVVDASPAAGEAPLEVTFDAAGSSDPDAGDVLSYAWDLDGDGDFDDGTEAQVTRTYTATGRVTAKLRVTDSIGATDTASTVITVGEHAPVPEIDEPSGSDAFMVGETVSFRGHATDPEEGDLPPSSLTWSASILHCETSDNCHTHPDLFEGEGASGSFVLPDHDYPSQVELKLTATASDGEKVTTKKLISFRTSQLSFASNPPGIDLTVGTATATAPFDLTANVHGSIAVSAPATTTWHGVVYDFTGWSDGGARAHDLTVPVASTTYTANYQPRSPLLFDDGFEDGDTRGWTTISGGWKICRPGTSHPALCSTQTSSNLIVAGNPAWRDYSVEASVWVFADAGAAPIIGRYVDGEHWYQLQLGKNRYGTRLWMLQRRDGPNLVLLASGPYNYAINKYYSLRLAMKGSTLTADISADGRRTWQRLVTRTDSTLQAGRIGMRSLNGTTAAFDVIRVYRL
jgi:glucose/arabinose dehydrogenase